VITYLETLHISLQVIMLITRQASRQVRGSTSPTQHLNITNKFTATVGSVANKAHTSVADTDPGSGAFLTTGSGMGKKSRPDPG
jgi:hypothetical protein